MVKADIIIVGLHKQPSLSLRMISFYRLNIRDGAFAGGEGRELGPLKPEDGPPDEKPERG